MKKKKVREQETKNEKPNWEIKQKRKDINKHNNKSDNKKQDR